METTLNKEQAQAVEDVFKFLFSDEKEMRLSGAGGTGKTFTMKYILQKVLNDYTVTCETLGIAPAFNEVVITATTNKAASVLNKAISVPTSTIHSYLGLTVKENYKTGETELKKTSAYKVHSNCLVFIDEYSMIDSKLYRIIQESFYKSKIIFIGDHCQMAPVFETSSPVDNTPSPITKLTIPVRNAGSPALINLCQQWRDTVENNIWTPIVPDGESIILLSGSEAGDYVNNTFIDPNNNSRILCYTNSRVLQYNQHIRELRKLGEAFSVGEKVVSNNSISTGSFTTRIDQEYTITDINSVIETKTVGNSQLDFYSLTLDNKINVNIPVNMDFFLQMKKYFADNKNWTAYFYLHNSVADLRMKDASTVYKAQGSTFEEVFIDITDINNCKRPDQIARMMYVAVSRPTTKLYMYGTLKGSLFS